MKKNPPTDSWCTTALLCGSLMDSPNSDSYNDYKDNGMEVKKKVLQYIPENFTIIELYDYHLIEGGSYTSSEDNLNRTSVSNYINSGLGIVNFVSHGYDNANGLAEYSGNGVDFEFSRLYYYTDALSANNGYKLPFIFSGGCVSGNFTEEDDTNFESMITNPDGGAIALIAPSGHIHRGEYQSGSYGSWWLDDNLWKLFFNGCYKTGMLLYQLKQSHYNYLLSEGRDPENPYYLTCKYSYNLLGEPELNVWTNVPQQLIVNIPDILYTDQKTHFDIYITDFNLCISKDNEIHINTTSETFNSPHNSGTYHLVVTSTNYVPYETTITFEENLNDPPIIITATLPDATEGILYEVLVGVEDPDVGDTHTFELLDGPSWLSIGSETGMLTGTPGEGDVTAEKAINVRVTDSGGLIGERSYTIGVISISIEPPSNIQVLDIPDDNGHKLRVIWNLSISEDDGQVDWYRIYRSRTNVLTYPIPLTQFTSIDSLNYYDQHYTILIDSVATGTTEYIDEFVPINGVLSWFTVKWNFQLQKLVTNNGDFQSPLKQDISVAVKVKPFGCFATLTGRAC